MYTITYGEAIEKELIKAIEMGKRTEVAILAMANMSKNEICIEYIMKKLTEGQTDLLAYVEPEMQIKFMKYCDINQKIPVIIHTHIYATREVSFSQGDEQFIKAFQSVQKKIKCKENSLFLVYGVTQVALQLMVAGNIERGKIIDNTGK